jgi:hypothetical protein
VGIAFNQAIIGSGGTAPYSFAVTSGTLPEGLDLSSAGVLAGTPTTAGSAPVTIQGTDADGCLGTVVYTIVIAAAPPPPPVCPAITLAPATLPGGMVGFAFNQVITSSGGTPPYGFGVTSGALPDGLTLTSAGVLAGTPAAAGSTPVTIRGTDADGCFGTIAYTIVIAAAPPPPPVCPAITLAPATLPGGMVGIAFTQVITSSGGTAPYGFGVASGALPSGLALTSAGVLAGTPTAAGTSGFTIRATDTAGCFATLPLTIVVSAIEPVPTLPQGLVLLVALALLATGWLRVRRAQRPSRT